jgi:hypothetical protein
MASILTADIIDKEDLEAEMLNPNEEVFVVVLILRFINKIIARSI